MTSTIATTAAARRAASTVLLLALLASCLPQGPEDQPAPDASIRVSWTIGGIVPDARLCGGLSGREVKVELWEDSDCDGSLLDGFYVYRFDCPGGTDPSSGALLAGEGVTANAFFSGVPTCVKTVLVAKAASSTDEDVVLAASGAFAEVVPAQGSVLDLGTVDFVLEEFGPLDLELTWESRAAAGSYGACADAAPPVAYIGYRLILIGSASGEGDTIVDELSADSRSAACAGELAWPFVPFGRYLVEVRGRNEAGDLLWEGGCGGCDVIVDDTGAGSNSCACAIPAKD